MIQSASAPISGPPPPQRPTAHAGSEQSNKGFSQAWDESEAAEKKPAKEAADPARSAASPAESADSDLDADRPETPDLADVKAEPSVEETKKRSADGTTSTPAPFNSAASAQNPTTAGAPGTKIPPAPGFGKSPDTAASDGQALDDQVRAEVNTMRVGASGEAQKTAQAAQATSLGGAQIVSAATVPLKSQAMVAKEAAQEKTAASDRNAAATDMLRARAPGSPAATPPLTATPTPVPPPSITPAPPLTPAAASLFEQHAALDQAKQVALDTESLFAQQASVSTSATAMQGLALNRAQAPQVAAQIAMATVNSKAGTTEIALNPEELGRVRITLTTSENGLAVSILAERPETADLMRRNLDILAAEFRDLGHENLSFTFGDQSAASDQNEKTAPGAATADSALPMPEIAPAAMKVALSGGLDLKL